MIPVKHKEILPIEGLTLVDREREDRLVIGVKEKAGIEAMALTYPRRLGMFLNK